MMKKQKQTDNFLMANIQVVYMQKRLLKKEDFDELIYMNDWYDIRQFLSRFGYRLAEEVTVGAVDNLYQSQLEKLEKDMYQLNFPDDYLKVLFVKRDTFQQIKDTAYQNLDEKVLEEYGKYANSSLHPLIAEYAKYRIDEYFLNGYFRNSTHTISLKRLARGNFSNDELTELEKLPVKNGIEWLQHTAYRDVFASPFETITFEKRFDDWLIKHYHQYRYQTIGLEGIFTYILEKIFELFNLRLVLKSKIYRLSTEEMRERMRVVYG